MAFLDTMVMTTVVYRNGETFTWTYCVLCALKQDFETLLEAVIYCQSHFDYHEKAGDYAAF